MSKFTRSRIALIISILLSLIVLLTGALPTAAQGRGGYSTDETIVVRLAGSPYNGPRDAR